ncbi:TonB-dependent receptor [Xanthomonas sp. GW]|uniref:TonB-dependent receptor n=1 Tax=Xanthomonas sp. GW TaxID=2724121 RepID=UPI00163A9EB8|nr:TonB-dependent receptor [Xanthomonas sp. GW]QNH22135.1 TonB-dependent receptor [Xanthomonas sp. GW]
MSSVARRNRLSQFISRALCCPASALLLLPSIALAQQDDGATAAKQLDTITVTAQKRSERLQDVPMSIQVLNTEKMSSEGSYKLADYFAQLPGLSYIQSPMSSNIVLRGIATDSGLGSRPTSGIVIDDVPYGSALSTGAIPDLDPSDLQQIEVLRGPQGTLYGASSMGGLIKYVMTDPDTSATFGRVEAGGSTAAHGGSGYNARTSVNLPFSDRFALRVSLFQRQDPAFVHNTNSGDENDSQVRGGRVSALWNVSDTVTVRSSALFQDTETGSSSVVDTDPDLHPLYGQYSHDRISGGDTFKGQVRFYTTKVSWDLGWAMLDSISGYAQHRSRAYQDVGYTTIGRLAPVFAGIFGLDSDNPSSLIDNRYNTDRTTQEVRLVSQGEHALDWQVGAFYSDEEAKSTQNFYIADKTSGTIYRDFPLLVSLGDSTYREKAVYADGTYHFTPQFDIQFGARYARNSLRENSDTGGLLQDPNQSFDSNKDSATTYLFSPRYRFNDELMTYLRVASGYRAGGSNGTLVANVPFSYDSDSLWSYELGLKTQLLDHSLSLDAALFYIDWSDLQISQVEPTLGSSYTTNAGKASSQGLELSVNWVPSADWKVTASYAYTDATLAQDIPGYTEGSSAYGKDGNRLPYSARNSASASLKRYFPLGSNLEGFAGADVAYMGDRDMEFTTSASIPRIHLPSYTTVGLNAGVQGQAWSATLYVRNLTDEVGYINANRRGSLASSPLGATLIQPRTVGLTLAWDY